MGDSVAFPPPTYDLSGEGAAGDVVFVVFDQDVVVSGQSGQVADAARPILVVHAVDLCLGRPLDGQVQAACSRHTNRLRQGRVGGAPRKTTTLL